MSILLNSLPLFAGLNFNSRGVSAYTGYPGLVVAADSCWESVAQHIYFMNMTELALIKAVARSPTLICIFKGMPGNYAYDQISTADIQLYLCIDGARVIARHCRSICFYR